MVKVQFSQYFMARVVPDKNFISWVAGVLSRANDDYSVGSEQKFHELDAAIELYP
jgi:hypothetical protein